jgi:hypothetical protein
LSLVEPVVLVELGDAVQRRVHAIELILLVDEVEGIHVPGDMARVGHDLALLHRRDEALLVLVEIAGVVERMLTGQASLLLALLFLLNGGITAWRRGDGMGSLVLTVSLCFAVVVGTVKVVLVFWGLAQLPILVTPLFLFVALIMGSELSLGLLRAARAEYGVRIKDAALTVSEERLARISHAGVEKGPPPEA